MAFTSQPEASPEWFETDAVAVDVAMPEPDEDYAYFAARLLSWFPVVNSKGATYFSEDFDFPLLETLKGKQANLEHDRTRIVGTIYDYLVTDEGIDVVVQVDRRCADLQGLDLADLKSGQYFSHVSVELTRSLADCHYYAIDEGYNVQQKIPVKTGNSMGMRRTTNADPYMFQGNRVIERIKPARFTGVGAVPNPADTTAQVYALAASEDAPEVELASLKQHEINVFSNDHVDMSRDSLTPGHHFADPGWQADGKKRYQLDDAGHVASAAKFFGEEKNRDKYSPEHRKEIDATIDAAKKKFGVGDEHKESASAEELPIQENPNMTEAEIAKLQEQADAGVTASAKLVTAEGELTSVKDELASANGKIVTLETELATLKDAEKARETAAAIEAFMEKAHAAKPFVSDEERAAFREEAAHAVDNVGRMEHVLVIRERDRLASELAAVKAAAEPKVEPKADEKPADESEKKGETASDGDSAFKANRPTVGVGPAFNGSNSTAKSLDAIY